MTPNEDTRDPAEIEREIRQTQNEMSRTVNQIEEQLTPRNLMNSLLDEADRNGIDARWLLDQARRNPLALGMIAAGGLWLISDSDARPSALMPHHDGKRARTRPEWDDSHFRAYVEHMTGIEPMPGEDDLAYRRRRNRARANYLMIEQRHDEDENSFGKRLDEATDRLREQRDKVMDSARQARLRVGREASHLASNVSQQASRAARETRGAYEQNPLLGGIAAALAGAIVGAALPVSRTEEEHLGEYGSEAIDKASAKAREKKDEIVEEADRQIRDSGGGSGEGEANGSDLPKSRFVVRPGEQLNRA